MTLISNRAYRLSSFDTFANGTAALDAAFAKINTDGGGTLFIDGIFNVNSAPAVIPDVPVQIYGDGGQNSQLVKGDPGTEFRLLAKDSTNTVEYLECRNFRLVGDWNDDKTGGGNDTRLARFLFYNRAIFDGVELYYSRQFSLSCGRSNSVTVRNCRVIASARDGINVTNSHNVNIHDNVIMHCGDDAIAVHDSSAVEANVRKGIRITGNHIVDSIGIKALGAWDCLIANNVIDFPKNKGIDLGRDGSEGQKGNKNVHVIGNVITNITPGAVSGLGNVETAIRVVATGDPITNFVIKNNMGGNSLADGNYTSFRVITDTTVNPTFALFNGNSGWIDPAIVWTGKAYAVTASNAVAETTVADNDFDNLAAGTITDA